MVNIINEADLIYTAGKAYNHARQIVVQMAMQFLGFREPKVPPSQDHQWTLYRVY
jgi:hypothetical protein